MELQFIKSGTVDEISISGSIVTVNGTEYDLDNLSETTTDPFYTDPDDGTTQGKLNVSNSIFSAFAISLPFKDADGNKQICQNILLYFDIDGNGDISIDEFKTMIDVINMSEEDRRAVMSARWKDLTDGKRLSELTETDRINVLMTGVSNG